MKILPKKIREIKLMNISNKTQYIVDYIENNVTLNLFKGQNTKASTKITAVSKDIEEKFNAYFENFDTKYLNNFYKNIKIFFTNYVISNYIQQNILNKTINNENKKSLSTSSTIKTTYKTLNFFI